MCVLQVVRLSREALSRAALGVRKTAAATLCQLKQRGLVGKRAQRVRCLHLFSIPDQLRSFDLGVPLKDRILRAAKLLVRPEDQVLLKLTVPTCRTCSSTAETRR